LPSSRWVGLLLLVPSVAGWCAIQLTTGTPWDQLGRFVLAVVVAVLLPGFVVVRAMRARSAPLLEDLAWAIPTGMAVALAGWFVGHQLPGVPKWLITPVMAAVVLLLPTARRRVLARPAGRWRPGSLAALTLSALVADAWMLWGFLDQQRLSVTGDGTRFYQDTLYQVTLVDEMRRATVPTYPMVAGEPLSYHWFVHAVLAHLCDGFGLDPLQTAIRLAPAACIPAVILVLATVARRLARLETAGWLAAVLFAVVSEPIATNWMVQGVGYSMVQPAWWASITASAGWFVLVATVGAGISWARRGGADAAVPVVLLPVFLLLCTGTKSSLLAAVASGFAAGALICLVTRQWRAALRYATVFAGSVIALGIGVVVIYGEGSYGLVLWPGRALELMASNTFPEFADPLVRMGTARGAMPVMLVVVTTVLFLLPSLIRGAGAVLLAVRRWRDPAVATLVGAWIAGLGAAVTFRHPGGSENWFLIQVYPLLVIASAWGWGAALATRFRVRGWLLAAVAGGTVGALLAWGTASLAGPVTPWRRWFAAHPGVQASMREHGLEQIWATTWPWVLLLAGIGLLALALRWAAGRRQLARWRPLVAVAAVGLLLGPGLFGTVLEINGAAPRLVDDLDSVRPGSLRRMSPDQLTAGRWLRAHADSHDVMAVNVSCVPVPRVASSAFQNCDSRSFTMTAAAGLRSDVEGWAYAGRNVQEATTTIVPYSYLPFWDPARLQQQRAAFTHPTPESLDRLRRRYGVRWLVADLRSARFAPNTADLDRLAVRRLSLPTVLVWELPPPREAKATS
jgi:hypothetical protein